MNTLYSICTALLLLASPGANAQSTLCDKWRNSLGQCKSCGEAPYLSTLRIMGGPARAACGGYCTRLPPLVPRNGGSAIKADAALVLADASDLAKLGLSAQDGGAARCTPDFSGTSPDDFYAIAFATTDLERLAPINQFSIIPAGAGAEGSEPVDHTFYLGRLPVGSYAVKLGAGATVLKTLSF
jgi:hypothetical protein